MRPGPTVVRLALLASVGLFAGRARANCARPVGYEATVVGSTVEIESISFERRRCPDPAGMLRENVATGHVVKLADVCTPSDASAAGEEAGSEAGGADDEPHPAAHATPAYVDRCVPPGKYRYGFANPYECQPSSCSTDFYVEVTVEAPLSAGCRRPGGERPPAPFAAAPWKNEQAICGSSTGAVLTFLALGVLAVFVALVAIAITAIVLLRRRQRTPGAPR